MKMLNVGCGYRYHPEWTNLDFIKTGPSVVAHDLKKGIPFEDESFDVVYHAHLLEHFTKQEGLHLIKECFRVLKAGGIIRIAVPDLEKIMQEYTKNLEGALKGDNKAQENYEWTLLELYDQTVRNFSGGEMARYLYKDNLENAEYVFSRTGEETRSIRENYLKNKKKVEDIPIETKSLKLNKSFIKKFLKLQTYNNIIHKLAKHFLTKEEREWLTIGKFRKEGEVHQWMYDRYSLSKLLKEVGFKDVQVRTAFESAIPEWNKYELESKDNVIFKPDSLFIEAKK